VLYGYRNGKLLQPADDLRLEAGDDLIPLTNSTQLKELKKRGKAPGG